MRHHHPHRQASSSSHGRAADPPGLQRARQIAHWMDSAFHIPLLRKRIGLDPILGLMPVWGDAIALLLSAYVVYVAYELGVPRRVLFRMGLNILMDFLLGLLPVVGDLSDAAWKANKLNVQLLEEAYDQLASRPPEHSAPDSVIIDIQAEPA